MSAEQIRNQRIAEAHAEYERGIDAAHNAEIGIANAVTLADHFSATISLRIAELQPQHGVVQLNATRGKTNTLISCDVKRDAFIAAVEKVLDVTITPNKATS